MMRSLTLAGMLLIAMLSGSANTVDCADYVVDQARSELVVRLSKAGMAAAIAHNHVIRASEFSGEAVFDPEDLARASLHVEAQAGSLVADEPEVRRKYGLSKGLSERDRRKIQKTMLSASQMDVAEHPMLEFCSTSVEEGAEGQYLVTGNLTIHGVERAIAFPVMLKEEGGALRGRATIEFKQSDFGIKPFSAMLGALRNRDEAVLHVEIFAVPAERTKAE